MSVAIYVWVGACFAVLAWVLGAYIFDGVTEDVEDHAVLIVGSFFLGIIWPVGLAISFILLLAKCSQLATERMKRSGRL